jgi:hypothetical protein
MIKNISLKELYLIYPIESLFYILTKDIVVKIDKNKYPNWIFYFNNNDCIFGYDTKNADFYCSYDNFSMFFYENFNINWLMLSKIVKDLVEKHFLLNGITPMHGLDIFYKLVVNHFQFNLNCITQTLIKV